MKPIMVVVGTRPEITKMAPVVRALKKNNLPSLLVHCGQHHDYNMSRKLIEDLGLPQPDHEHKLESSSQGIQTARIIMHMEQLLKSARLRLFSLKATQTGSSQQPWRRSSLEFLLGTWKLG
jgi:UDP-N-acetylglucosamine 2-epimerase